MGMELKNYWRRTENCWKIKILVKVYCFDIDGTICTNTDGDYEKAKPYLTGYNK